MIKGISQAVHPEATSSDYIYWAKNCLLSRKLDAGINEKGNLALFDLSTLNIQFKAGVTTIGTYIILCYKDNANNDCIVVLNEFTNTVSVKVVRTDLNFNSAYPIQIRAKFNAKNELVIAFTDFYNTPKYINLDTASITDSLNFYNLFPINYNSRDIVTNVLESGNVLSGAYFIAFQYIARDRTRSAWTPLSNPTYITPIQSGQSALTTKGATSGVAANKAISILLPDIDTSYSKVAIAILSKVNGVVSQKIVKEISITGSTISTIYNGTEFISDLTLEELLTEKIVYLKAGLIETLNDQLFLGDLTVADTIDFQAIVNQTVLTWTSTYDGTNDLVNSSVHKAGNLKTFIHDEVYAFYMQFELLDGTFTSWFHIPGRVPTSGERGNSVIYNSGLLIDGATPKVFQVEDTCGYSGLIDFDGVRIGDKLGAWENANEVYPTGFPDYAGQAVRHHKFPSVQYMSEQVWSDKPEYGLSNLDRLGIKITNGAINYSLVKGYRVGYAKRTLGDTGVLGMGLTMFAASPEISGGSYDLNTLINAGGNFNVDSLSDVNDNIHMNSDYLRFNSFDLWQDKPSITNSYLRNYIKYKANNLATGVGLDPHYGTVAACSILSTPQVDLTSYASNFTILGGTRATKSNVSVADMLRKLSEQLYVPNNVNFSSGGKVIDNRGQEETILAKIEGTALGIGVFGDIKTLVAATHAENSSLAEETFLASLKVAKANYFLSFDNQTIVTNPTIFRFHIPSNRLDNTGDGFIGTHSYVSVAPYNKNTTATGSRIVNFKIHVGVSRHNINLRYQTLGDYTTYFYSDGGMFQLNNDYSKYWFWLNSRTNAWNQFQYHKDFSTLNDFDVAGIFNRDNINQDTYNYRIIRSTKASKENALEDGWKTFKPLDYFDTVRNKGRLSNLQAWGEDALLIHHENALYRTRDKAVLQANIVNISLGSGDIFALEPKEVSPTRNGVGGTQHKYSCLLTHAGYFFVDSAVHSMYLYDGEELKEIGKGLDIFFLDNLYVDGKDNPLNDEGICIAFEQDYDRIFLSQKAAERSFTLSFSLERMEWVSAHDFIPDLLFNTRTSLYSFKGNVLYTHDEGDRGKYYGVSYPFYVDFVVNDEAKEQKVLSALSWLSKVYNTDGSVNQRKTITSVTVWNQQHCSDKVDIATNETDSLFVDANAKVVDESWYFDDLFDNVIDPNSAFVDGLLNDSRPLPGNLQKPAWYDSEPLRGKYFIVRLEYSNIENKEVHLRDLIPTLRKSES